MIELIDLTKNFGNAVAVDDLSLHVERGEIFGFLGPNGSGKTTTIKMMTGLYRPTAGRIRIGEFDLSEEPLEAKALVGYVPDEPFIYEQLTGWEFLNFVGAIYGMDRAEREKKIEELLEMFPIVEVVDGYFGDFSRGTKQKITVLAALLHDPKVLVIDEPIVGLDPLSVRILKDIIEDFAAGGGTVFMSTHSLDVAQSICTRVAIINHGKLQDQGTLPQLRKIASLNEGTLEDLFLTLTS